jgi:hypothetical protein
MVTMSMRSMLLRATYRLSTGGTTTHEGGRGYTERGEGDTERLEQQDQLTWDNHNNSNSMVEHLDLR